MSRNCLRYWTRKHPLFVTEKGEITPSSALTVHWREWGPCIGVRWAPRQGSTTGPIPQRWKGGLLPTPWSSIPWKYMVEDDQNYLSVINIIEHCPLYRAVREAVQIGQMTAGKNNINRCVEWGTPGSLCCMWLVETRASKYPLVPTPGLSGHMSWWTRSSRGPWRESDTGALTMRTRTESQCHWVHLWVHFEPRTAGDTNPKPLKRRRSGPVLESPEDDPPAPALAALSLRDLSWGWGHLSRDLKQRRWRVMQWLPWTDLGMGPWRDLWLLRHLHSMDLWHRRWSTLEQDQWLDWYLESLWDPLRIQPKRLQIWTLGCARWQDGRGRDHGSSSWTGGGSLALWIYGHKIQGGHWRGSQTDQGTEEWGWTQGVQGHRTKVFGYCQDSLCWTTTPWPRGGGWGQS